VLEDDRVAVEDPDLARFLALVCREIGAREASVLDAPGPEGAVAAAPSSADPEHELRGTTPGGRVVVARYDEAVTDRDVKQRRLDMLVSTFDSFSEDSSSPRSRPPAAHLLHDELERVRGRAGAVNALVIDANSPILWAAARPRDVVPEAWNAAWAPETTAGATDAAVAERSREALDTVRGVVDLGALRRGKRVRHVERDRVAPFLAHSFAGFYLLTLVFDDAFDELRAERAILESLVRIEHLVMALPPIDPPPQQGAGVVALRRPRRR
jgi:hypothetical protein